MENQNRPYVLWRRVSTKQQGASGLGLDAQQTIAEYFMHGKPVKVYTDVYSGTKLGECPDLKNAMRYCKQHGYLLVIAKTDRFRDVQDALAILDEMGEDNLCFCDLPTTDRTVLTIVWAMWERQALMGRINTKKALDERRKQRDNNGYWISKSGRVCTKFGKPSIGKDEYGRDIYDLSAANAASALSRANAAAQWKASSVGYKWAMDRVREGWTDKKIVEEFNKLHEYQPEVYCTRTGKPLSYSRLSLWKSEANILLVG